MSLLGRLQALHDHPATVEHNLMCPTCGQTGRPAEETGESETSFVLRGDEHGNAVRKCYLCGSGFLVKGENTEAIPAARWARMEAKYEQEMTAIRR